MMSLFDERGTGLVFAILIVGAVVVLGMTLAFLTRTDVNISRHQTQHVEALFVAEAGTEEALHRLALPDPTNLNVNGSTINAAIRDASNPPDPDWRARIFLCNPGAEPAAPVGEHHTVTIQDAGSWLEYSSPDEPDETVTIRHKWKDLNDDGIRDAGEIVLYDTSKFPPENFTTGKPVEVITVTGKDGTAERVIVVEAIRFPLNINVRAALLCDRGVDVRGNVSVCGHNHSINTPTYTMIPACQNWEACNPGGDHLAGGCLIGIVTTGDEVDRRGSTNLGGYPGPMDTSSTNQFYTLAQTLGISQDDVDAILANADYHDVGEAYPQEGITYVENAGGVSAMWNNGIGSGLLYVTGDLEVSGNFIYRGLVYVEGDFKITGTPWVLGAVVVRGISDYAFTGGNPAILYSSEAIEHYLSQHLDYIKLGWKETSGL
jgi:hypothetical protein